MKKEKEIHLPPFFSHLSKKTQLFSFSSFFFILKGATFFHSHRFSFASAQDHWPRLLHFHANLQYKFIWTFFKLIHQYQGLEYFFLVRTLVYTVYVHKTPSFKKRSIYEVNLPFSCLINLCSYFNFRVESVSWSRNYEMIASGHSPLNYVINTWWIYPGINH